MMQESKVTARGQTTLPRDVRAALGLEAGDSVRYIVENGRVEMLKARHVRELSGMLRRPGQRTVSLDEMYEALAEGVREIEVTEKAATDWTEMIEGSAVPAAVGQGECTPGYFNAEGQGSGAMSVYLQGPVAFFNLLENWRNQGMHEGLQYYK